MKGISSRQTTILDFIRNFLDDNGFPPTIRDIQRSCDISSTSVVDYNLNALRERGYLTRRSDVSRGLQLVEDTRQTPKLETIAVPLVGTIAAGEPISLPSANVEVEINDYESIELPQSIAASTKRLYALHVKGLSMVDALIDDGDTVIMKQAHQVETGQIAAVRLKLEDETTLKRVYLEDSTIRLQPANPLMDPIHVPANNVEILSRLIAVWRFLG